jgi:hypothetical protein
LERRTFVVDGGRKVRGWQVLIDGGYLLERVREYERALAIEEGAPRLAGAYAPNLLTGGLGLLGRDLGGDGVPEEKVAILGCDCGWPDCWPLAVRVTVDDAKVRWSDFEQPFRDWDYSGFGPFEFDLRAVSLRIGEVLRHLAAPPQPQETREL